MKNRLWGPFIKVSKKVAYGRYQIISLLFAIAAALGFAFPIAASASTVAFDTSAVNFGTNPSVSFTRGTTSANYIGLVFLQNGGANTESGCTWGGTAMTQVVDVNDANLSHNALYYIVAPPAGAQTVSCSTSGNFDMGVVTYSGVNQSSPLDTIKYGQQYATSSAIVPVGNTLSVTGTTVTDGDWTVMGANYGSKAAADAGSTVRAQYDAQDPILFDSNGPISPAGSTSMAIKNISPVTEGMMQIMVALKPVSNIAFDTSAVVYATNPSISFTRGTTSANYIGIVFLQNGGANTESGCTWGGTAMTQVVDVNATDANLSHNAMYYIVAPGSGTQTVACTTSGNFDTGIVTYSGVNQSNPLDTIKYGQQYATSSAAAVSIGNTLSVTGTTTSDGDWTVMGANYGSKAAADAGSTVRAQYDAQDPILFDSNGPISPAGSTSMAIKNISPVTEGMMQIMVALQSAF